MELLTTEQENHLRSLVIKTLNNYHVSSTSKQWMSISEAAKYVGVSYNTFTKFRVTGLKICEIDGIKRVSKDEIDTFLNQKSY